jgi:hypothetical protein
LSALIAVAAGVAAALMLGISAVADQRSTKRVRSRRVLSPRIVLDLARQPLWLTALAANVAGFALQVVALSFGSLELVQPDLRDLQHNTRDGVHIASLAGTWVALVGGFGGLRDADGTFSFAPQLPAGLTRLAFTLFIRGRRLRVEIMHTEARYAAGPPLSRPAPNPAHPSDTAPDAAQPAAGTRARTPPAHRVRPAKAVPATLTHWSGGTMRHGRRAARRKAQGPPPRSRWLQLLLTRLPFRAIRRRPGRMGRRKKEARGRGDRTARSCSRWSD